MIYSDVALIIPSRLGSTRLPKKALIKIGNKSMIEHIVTTLLAGAAGHVYVATDSKKIAAKISNLGATPVMTSKDCPTGSDRVYEAYRKIAANSCKIKYVINIQGDLPFINFNVIEQITTKLKDSNFDIVTPAVKVGRSFANKNSDIKIVTDIENRALFFSRSEIPYGAKELLYHVGIYGYRIEALEKFVHLDQTQYESVEKLEQLRALEHGMSIGVVLSDEIPISVDTYEDLERAREYYEISIKKQQ